MSRWIITEIHPEATEIRTLTQWQINTAEELTRC